MRTKAVLLLFTISLGFYAACRLGDPLQPKNPTARPWKNETEKVSFMFQISTFLSKNSGDIDGCLERVQSEIHGNSVGFRPHDYAQNQINLPLRLVQSAGESPRLPEDECRKPLESCGNCHLPRKNNCNYRVDFTIANREMKAFGKLQGADASSITLARNCVECAADDEPADSSPEKQMNSRGQKIPRADIIRTVWLDGADLPETWWDFKSLSARGDVAKKMFAISTENNVACTNCHVKHGDFRLTSEGETFGKTGKVIRRVPLR